MERATKLPSGAVSSGDEFAALAGDPEQAWQAYVHYAHDVGDADLTEAWARIAAENGSADGMVAYVTILYSKQSPAACERARFWIQRAKASGYSGSNAGDLGKQPLDDEWREHCQALAKR
jgi:hypothetical protein